MWTNSANPDDAQAKLLIEVTDHKLTIEFSPNRQDVAGMLMALMTLNHEMRDFFYMCVDLHRAVDSDEDIALDKLGIRKN